MHGYDLVSVIILLKPLGFSRGVSILVDTKKQLCRKETGEL